MDPGLTRAVGDRTLDRRLVEQLAELRSFLQRLVGRGASPLDVEDLVQDVMERALRYAHTFDERRELLPWLRRMAFRVFLDARRGRERWPVALDPGAAEVGGRAIDDVADRDEIEHQLAVLGRIERVILCRFHRDGWSVAEIAADLEMPAGTVKSHLHRARRRLAKVASSPTGRGAWR